MYVCVYVCRRTCTHTCTHAYIYMCVCVSTLLRWLFFSLEILIFYISTCHVKYGWGCDFCSNIYPVCWVTELGSFNCRYGSVVMAICVMLVDVLEKPQVCAWWHWKCIEIMGWNVGDTSSDSKCGFGRAREKSLKGGNRIPYHAENAVRPTQKPLQCGRFVADRPHFESLVITSYKLSADMRRRDISFEVVDFVIARIWLEWLPKHS